MPPGNPTQGRPTTDCLGKTPHTTAALHRDPQPREPRKPTGEDEELPGFPMVARKHKSDNAERGPMAEDAESIPEHEGPGRTNATAA